MIKKKEIVIIIMIILLTILVSYSAGYLAGVKMIVSLGVDMFDIDVNKKMITMGIMQYEDKIGECLFTDYENALEYNNQRN